MFRYSSRSRRRASGVAAVSSVVGATVRPMLFRSPTRPKPLAVRKVRVPNMCSYVTVGTSQGVPNQSRARTLCRASAANCCSVSPPGWRIS